MTSAIITCCYINKVKSSYFILNQVLYLCVVMLNIFRLVVLLVVLSDVFSQRVVDSDAPEDFDVTAIPGTASPVIFPTGVPVGSEKLAILDVILEILRSGNISEETRAALTKSINGTTEDQIAALTNALSEPNISAYHKEIINNALTAARNTPQPISSDDDDDDGFPWLLLAILIGSILLCCTVIGFLWNRYRNKEKISEFDFESQPNIKTPPSPTTSHSSDRSVGMPICEVLKVEESKLKIQAAPLPIQALSFSAGRGSSYQFRTPSVSESQSRLRPLPEDDSTTSSILGVGGSGSNQKYYDKIEI